MDMNNLNALIKKYVTKLPMNLKVSQSLKHQLNQENKPANTDLNDFECYEVSVDSPFYKILYKHDSARPYASQHSSARMIKQFMSNKDTMFIQSDKLFSNNVLYFTVNKSENIPKALGLIK